MCHCENVMENDIIGENRKNLDYYFTDRLYFSKEDVPLCRAVISARPMT